MAFGSTVLTPRSMLGSNRMYRIVKPGRTTSGHRWPRRLKNECQKMGPDPYDQCLCDFLNFEELSEKGRRWLKNDWDGPTTYHDMETCIKCEVEFSGGDWDPDYQSRCGSYEDEPVILGTERTARLRHYDGSESYHLPNCDQVIQQRVAAKAKGFPSGTEKVWLAEYSTMKVVNPVEAYNPNTIIRDIMRADGFHPTLPPLNAHFYDLSQDRVAERPPRYERAFPNGKKRPYYRLSRKWR